MSQSPFDRGGQHGGATGGSDPFGGESTSHHGAFNPHRDRAGRGSVPDATQQIQGDPFAEQGPAAPPPNTNPWNVPNALTTLRLLMVPLFAWMLLAHPDDFWWRVGTAAVFTVAILTDALDGHLARKNNIVTDFGKIADPIADKALTGMAFVGLSIIGELWWWVTIVILIREWGITLMRFIVLRQGVVLAANRGGKAKTVVQAIALILMLLPIMVPFNAIGQVVMGAAFILTVATGIDYLVSTVRRWKQQKQPRTTQHPGSL